LKIARFEYRTRFMTRLFGSKYTANTVMALIIVSGGMVRNLTFVYHFCPLIDEVVESSQ
jgi:hypothetical protein